MEFDLVLLAELLVTALLAAAVGFAVLVVLMPRRTPAARSVLTGSETDIAFLFDGEVLVDATPSARALLSHGTLVGPTPWVRLLAWLGPRFPEVPDRFDELAVRGRIVLPSRDSIDPPLILTAEIVGGLTRVVLTGPEGALTVTDPLTERAIAEELAQLRSVAGLAPLPIWRTDAAGAVVWANATYLQLVAARMGEGQDLAWPLPKLFDVSGNRLTAASQRHSLPSVDGAAARWFDLRSVPDAAPGAGHLQYALPADAAVQAETSLKGFMQTLAKTFAHLPTGLAIFDERRQLMLYNPALVDLTGLPPDLLSARPTLPAMLDAMRDRAMLPEPKNYRSWRGRISDVERATASEPYEEIWTLPGGQTYRVAGRPQPNGALALMIDDISTEMRQTRRYRADLELGQAVIDAMDEAIAVFSVAGTLVLSNAAYAAMWGHDPGGALDNEATVAALCAHWRARTAPTAVWDRAEAFAVETGTRLGWSDEVRMGDGRLVMVRFDRLAGGATLAGFRSATGVSATPAVFSSVRKSA